MPESLIPSGFPVYAGLTLRLRGGRFRQKENGRPDGRPFRILGTLSLCHDRLPRKPGLKLKNRQRFGVDVALDHVAAHLG